mgnify:CR=1 FL=1
MHLADFGLHFSDHSFEGLWALLAVFRKGKQLGLCTGADPRDSVAHETPFLKYEHKDGLGFDVAIEVFQLEALFVETCQNLAAGHPENQLFEVLLLHVVYRPRKVGDLDAALRQALLAAVTFATS